ncbi:hypothetical protein BGX24_005970, partial [Mortierella sp. AD032]
MDLAARVASLASADPSLSYKVTSSLENVLVEICEQLRIDPAGAGSRVLTSPPSSAGGGQPGGVGGSGFGAAGSIMGGVGPASSMNMTSPTSASSGFCSSSSSSSPLSPSDYVVTYPGCVISVKNTPNQKGRPSSISSPVVDSAYGLGLGMSPLNDRKRSLSEECFTRHGIGGNGSSGAAPSFGSAMTATQMITQLDMATPLQGALSGLDSSGLLMMQSGGYHPHSHPHQQHPHQIHPQQQQQQQQLYHQQQESQHHGNHHLPSGMASTFRPTQAHHHAQHQQHAQQHHHHHPLQPNDLSSALDLDAAEAIAASRAEHSSSMRRTHSVDIKQEMQSFYQPMLATPQLSAPPRRSGGSPGTVPPNQQQHQQQQQRLYSQLHYWWRYSRIPFLEPAVNSVSFSAGGSGATGAEQQYHFNAGQQHSSGSSSGHQGGGGGHHYLHPG